MRIKLQLLSYALFAFGSALLPMQARAADFPAGCVVGGSSGACVCSDITNSVAPPCTCKSPSYTAVLDNRTTVNGTNGPQTTYRYKISATPSKISSISDAQMVVPRPLTPNPPNPTTPDIFLPGGGVTSVQNYCDADKNSGVNKGNCDGFIVHVAPNATGAPNGSTFLNVVSGPRVADGLVTLNFVGGNGSTELCTSLPVIGGVSTPTGIVGPGDLGDPWQPKFAAQDATVAGGKCVAHLQFDKKGNLIDVTTDAPCCSGSPGQLDSCGGTSTLTDIKVNGEPLRNNNGPHGLTFGNGTTTCYGPSIPSPARCICTSSPCP